MKTTVKRLLSISAFILLMLAIAGCGQTITPAPAPSPSHTPPPANSPTPTFTPDPCAQENIDAEIQRVNRLMREFDDAATLSSYLTRDQLKPTIEDMQRIRRNAEDLTVPACLTSLRELQITHMNTYIQTLLVFMGGGDQETVNQGIQLSRQLHELYAIEMAKQQGVPISSTSTPDPTPTNLKGKPATQSPTPSVPIVTNAGPGGINIRIKPSLEGRTAGVLAFGQSALAVGQTGDGSWIKIEVPGKSGQTAWVYAALVQLSGPKPLPVIPSE